MAEFIELMKEKKYEEAVQKMVEKAESLKKAGAEFAAITANTPHMLFDRIQERSALPLVSIVEATCRECKRQGLKRSGLMGTGFTMNGTFYQDVFIKNGIEVIMQKKDKAIINQKVFSEIELGIFRDNTRQLLISITEKMDRKKHRFNDPGMYRASTYTT